jgi:hypothetical protein
MVEPSFLSPEVRWPEWQREFEAALLEQDREKLLARIMAAEAAIFNRRQAISQSLADEAERQALREAVAKLRILKRDDLGFPDWEKK